MSKITKSMVQFSNKFKICFLSIFLFYLLSFLYFEKWDIGIIGGGDAFGYNVYLPATFIHDDLDNLKETLATRYKYHSGFDNSAKNPLGISEAQHIGDGKQVIKYTVGVAVLQSPFFFLGHLTAWAMDYPMDGYSPPYIVWAHLAVFFYVFLGLFFLMKILREKFSETIVLLTVISVLLGTNLYYFTIYNSPMSHGYLFGLYCFLMYASARFYAHPKLKYALVIGLSAGMITLIRPVEIICLFIPVFYGISSIKERFGFVGKHWRLYLAAVGVYAIPGFLQMIYWKTVSGDWLFYSYGDEGFDFLNPKIWKGLTHFHNGWLIYTPIMIFALVGIFFLYKKSRWFWPTILFMPIHIYVAYSWWCWNYINGFGSRPMVETYALLSIPMAYCFAKFQQKKWSKYLLIGIISGLSVLNVFQTYQFSKGVMWSETSTAAYYFSTFGKTSLDYQDLVHYDSNELQPDTTEYFKVKDLYFSDFEDSLSVHFQRDIVYEGKFAYKLTKEKGTTPGFSKMIGETGAKKGDYFKISAWCYKHRREPTWWSQSTLVGNIMQDNHLKYHRRTWVDNKLQNDRKSLWGGKKGVWDKVVFFAKNRGKDTDVFKAFVQNSSGHPVFVDDLKVELWRAK